jgi:hypothetical protein
MPIKAFLSSTRSDLDADCRRAALDGIHHGGATPVAMETWVVRYGDPEQICLEKLKSDSTHYVGVFAWRDGGGVLYHGIASRLLAGFAEAAAHSRRSLNDEGCCFGSDSGGEQGIAGLELLLVNVATPPSELLSEIDFFRWDSDADTPSLLRNLAAFMGEDDAPPSEESVAK